VCVRASRGTHMNKSCLIKISLCKKKERDKNIRDSCSFLLIFADFYSFWLIFADFCSNDPRPIKVTPISAGKSHSFKFELTLVL